MGGKTSTSSSQVAIPPAVLAQYNSVNQAAAQTAQTPFQDYTGEFVAPVNVEQTAGITATNAGATEAQPYYQAATGVTGAAAAGTAAAAAPISGADINQYLSPYLSDVMGSTEALQNVSNQQQQAGQLGNAITSGAFGSDRTGIAAANLAQQQQLANENVLAGIANTGYTTAQGEANTEQQAALQGAGQLANIGTQLGALGTGAQTAALTGASAQLAAGTVQQQTQQAEDTALYNQFLQQQSYPFQVDQFLAGIAEGTGSLSGSTTTTTAPSSIFSDRRLKHHVRKIGKTFDGQDVVSYKMGDDARTHIGLIAQDVEKKHPEAVGVAGGFKTVDYGKATKEAANEGHFYQGGVAAFPRKRYATGGYPGDSGGLASVLAAQQAMYGQMGGGGSSMMSRVPQATSSTHGLAVSEAKPAQQPSTVSDISQLAGLAKTGDDLYNQFGGGGGGGLNTTADLNQSTGELTAFNAAQPSADQQLDSSLAADSGLGLKRGGVIPLRRKFDVGGTPYGVDSGQLNIPDDEQQTISPPKSVAPPTPESSTDQDIGDVLKLASMFVKRGGRVGYADGGSPDDDDSDATAAPDDTATTPGVAPTDTTQAPPTSLWDKIKNTRQDWIPILSGIAAAGAVPTVHWGQALAAGLGAGANSYQNEQTAIAEQQKTQAEAQAVNTQNRILAMKAKAASDYLNPTGGGVAGPPAPRAPGTAGVAPGPAPAAPAATSFGLATGTSPTTGAPAPPAASAAPAGGGAAPTVVDPAAGTAAAVDQAYRKKYFVQPGYTPDEQAQMQQAIRASMVLGDAPVNAVKQAHDNRVVTAQTNNQNAAQAEADSLYAQATDPTASPQAQQAALVKLNAIHQWTGDTYTDNAGQKINSRTGAPAIGVAAQTLTPEQHQAAWQAAYTAGLTPVTLGSGLPGFRWQQAGAASPQSYADQSIAPTGAQGPPAGQGATPPSLPQRPNAAPTRTAAPTTPTPAGPSSADPYTQRAFSQAATDPAYRIDNGPVATDQPSMAARTDRMEANQKNSVGLSGVASQITNEQAAVKQYLTSALDILNSKGSIPWTGLPGEVRAAISSKFNGVDAGNYEAVSKYLMNAAVQQGHTNFPNATQSEFAQQVQSMSPSVQMPPQTIAELAHVGLKTANWMMQSATRAQTWAKTPGVDPLAFNDFNQHFFPQDKLVNADSVATNPKTGQRVYFINGKWTP